MNKIIVLSVALATAGAFTVAAQETAPTTPDATTGTTGTTPPAATDDATTTAPDPTTTSPSADTTMDGTSTTMDTEATPPADTATMPSADTGMTGDMAMTVPEGFALYAGEPMTAEDLQDAPVYTADDRSVGSISDFVLAEDGAITQVIFDVGGFLGIGARNVAVPFEELQIYTNADATELRVYLPMTQEEMEALPEYTES